MIPEGNWLSNIDRFTGFADGYDRNRPQAPQFVTRILRDYLGHRPARVADVGCGTGLSTFIWKDAADQIIGVEPSPDMLTLARQKLALYTDAPHISFEQGYSNTLPLPSSSVDIITCSQSFHWMEPTSTLKEAGRVLREGGIFAAYDCEWPPCANWHIETAYMDILDHASDIIHRLADPQNRPLKLDKSAHLRRLEESHVFRYTREIGFHHTETADADRYIGLVLSQGGVQTVFKLGSKELDQELIRFAALVQDYFQGRTLEVVFSYRMRLGIK